MRNATTLLAALTLLPLVTLPINTATLFNNTIIEKTMIKTIIIQSDNKITLIIQNIGTKPTTITKIKIITSNITIKEWTQNITIQPKQTKTITLTLDTQLQQKIYKLKIIINKNYEIEKTLILKNN